MKNKLNQTNRYIRSASATVCAAIALATASVQAADTVTVFTFDSGVPGWALSAWGGQSQSEWTDAEDHTGNGGGALNIKVDWSGGDQMVVLGWYSGSQWWNDPSSLVDLTGYTNISFYLKWDTANSPLPMSTYRSTGEQQRLWAIPAQQGEDWPWIDLAGFVIPDLASNGWVKIDVPINLATPGIQTTYGLGFKKWVGNGNVGTVSFFIDDITLDGNPVEISPPSLSLAKPVTGLNLTTVTGPYQRESIATVNPVGWIGKGNNPVSYSYTVKQGVDGTDGSQFQTHIFLVPAPATDNGPDWVQPDVVFLDMESTGDGGYSWTFRYKTNQPNGNSMMYDDNVVPGSITSPTREGTWTVTFLNDTNVTMSGPGGVSTNFNLPGDFWQTAFANPVYAYFGVQSGNGTGTGKYTVLSSISVSGSDNDFTDNFETASSLDSGRWVVRAVDAPGVRLVTSTAKYWVQWTVPDAGFSLISNPSVDGSSFWQNVSGTPVQIGSLKRVLVDSSQLPGPDTGYWQMIKRQFTQLQVLLPGETNAPNTVTGKIGTPTPVTGGTIFEFTVNACDDTWNIVSGVSDLIGIQSTDGAAILPLNAGLNNGTATFQIQLNTAGSQTVTATNLTNGEITSGTSTVTVN
ncbi:MAG TPA: hypothetical protein PKA41_13700 [Verrucomicrobiota bacterium]|mgnify:CR=1 FL=1|nr:hypothetical protein [Verrucomicrobiota bacterium]